MAFFLRGVMLLYEKRFKIQDSPSPLCRGNHEIAVLQFIQKKKKPTQRFHTCVLGSPTREPAAPGNVLLNGSLPGLQLC